MIDPDIPKYAALLREHYLFKGFNEAQLAHVVARFKRVEIPAGKIVFDEGYVGEGFYLIYQGRVSVTLRVRDQDQQLDILGPGDYFGEDALLFDRPRSVKITALDPLILLELGRDDFYHLLQDFPQIRLNLSATAESRHIAQKENFDWLGDDEVIYLICRKHELFLFTSLIAPIVLGIVSVLLIAGAFSASTPFLHDLLMGAGISGIFGAIGWGIWNWIDWGNDYYIVTNQRVVWLERVIVFYYSRREAPLTQVLSVKVLRSYWGRVFNYGNIEVRTFTGGIFMRRAADPERFAYYIEGFQLRAEHHLTEEELAAMRTTLERRLHPEEQEPVIIQEPQEPESEEPKNRNREGLMEKFRTFLKMRYEKDGVITYRKHWLVLVKRTWQPVLVGVLLTLGVLFLIVPGLFNETLFLSGLPLGIGLLLAYTFVFFWWLYHYLDWSNDIYQLTKDAILDIERRPLGEEDKKTASLDSILSIEHSREGIIQLFFNYGDVVINVGQTDFIFRVVYNPDQVHQDVADYIEARRRRKEEAVAAKERERMADWFATYKDEVDEEGKTPKKTDWDLFPG